MHSSVYAYQCILVLSSTGSPIPFTGHCLRRSAPLARNSVPSLLEKFSIVGYRFARCGDSPPRSGEPVNPRTAVAMFASSVAALAQSNDGEPASRWWSHMQVLASDRLEGRRTGTPGHRKAVEYAAAQFKKAGLKPLGTHGYFQPVEFTSRTIAETQSKLELVRRGRNKELDLATDCFMLPTPDLARAPEAPLVVAGYCI